MRIEHDVAGPVAIHETSDNAGTAGAELGERHGRGWTYWNAEAFTVSVQSSDRRLASDFSS